MDNNNNLDNTIKAETNPKDTNMDNNPDKIDNKTNKEVNNKEDIIKDNKDNILINNKDKVNNKIEDPNKFNPLNLNKSCSPKLSTLFKELNRIQINSNNKTLKSKLKLWDKSYILRLFSKLGTQL